MRPMAVLTTALTAVLVAGATVPAAAAPAEVRWENGIAEQSAFSDAAGLAVSPDEATAYAVGNFRAEGDDHETPFVHAVDVATGATRWSTTLERGQSLGPVMVDPTTGQVLVAGTAWKGGSNEAVVTAFTPTGEQVWTSAVRGRQFYDMAVDATTGQVCIVSATGSGRIWSTRCWSRSGQKIFSDDFRSHSNSWPDSILIDDATHQVFVVGTRSKNFREKLTTIARSARGRALWQRSAPLGDDYEYVQDVAIDAPAKRLYVLVEKDRRAMVIGQRTTNGKIAFTRTFGSGLPKTPRPSFIDVLPVSHRVVVTSHARPLYEGTLRYLDKRGRQVALAKFRECCDLTAPVVDPATDRISIGWGPGTFIDEVPMDDEGVGAGTWDAQGVRMTDLDVALPHPARAVAAVASAGDDLLILGDRPFSDTEGPQGSFLVAVR